MTLIRTALAASAIAALLLAPGAGPALAQHAGHGAPRAAKPAAGTAAEMTDGEVRRIDAARGTILLKHAEIRSLGMGAMTMGFTLRDPAMAAGLQVGDRVRFSAVQEGEALIVTKIERR